MDRLNLLASLAGAVALAPLAVQAQSGAAIVLGPEQFRLVALEGGEFAMQTSRVALERSRNPAVRQFAQLEINEQTAFAASLGARPGTVPLRSDHAAMLQQLASLQPGPRFDQLYVQGQIMGHQELLQINGAYAQAGSDTLGQAVANLAVPSIQTHLTILDRLRRA